MLYLQGTHCGSPLQNQQKPQPVPGQTCRSAQSDPGGQSAPPETTRCLMVLQNEGGNREGWITVSSLPRVFKYDT